MPIDAEANHVEVRFRWDLQPERDLAHKIGEAIAQIFRREIVVTMTPLPSEEHSQSGQTPYVLRDGRQILTGQIAIIDAINNQDALIKALSETSATQE